MRTRAAARLNVLARAWSGKTVEDPLEHRGGVGVLLLLEELAEVGPHLGVRAALARILGRGRARPGAPRTMVKHESEWLHGSPRTRPAGGGRVPSGM